MKKILLIIVLFSFVFNSNAQRKKWPDPKKHKYSYGSYTPKGNGFILEDIVFSSEVKLTHKNFNEYKWLARIKVINYNIVGYKFNDAEYEIEVLSSYAKKFGLSKLVITSFKGSLVYKNGNTVNYLTTGGKDLDVGHFDGSIYVPHSNSNTQEDINEFTISDVTIVSVSEYRSMERLIKKMKEEGIEKEKYNTINRKVKTQAEKEAEARKSLAKIKRETIQRQYEIEKREREKKSEINAIDSSDPSAVSRRIREREAERKRKELEQNRKRLTKSTARAFTGLFDALLDGEGYFKLGYGMRSIVGDKPRKNPLDASTIELGFGFGKLGLFVGYDFFYSYKDLDTDRSLGKGNTFAFGLEYAIFKEDGFDFGLNVEYGLGDLEYQYRNNSGIVEFTDYSSNFYSIGAQVKLFDILYVSYNYGLFNTDETDRESGVKKEPLKGKYTKLGIGLKFDFGY
jgi:hypothetical protein